MFVKRLPVTFSSRSLRVQAIDGVPKIEGDHNPATWVLEVSNTSVENRTGLDFADVYEGSQLYKCAARMSCTHCPRDTV